MTADLHTLTGAYAVDALSDVERAEFDRHVTACPACRQEVRELRATAALLADAVAVQPPERLRTRVLADVTGTRQLSPRVLASRERGRLAKAWQTRVALIAAAASALAMVVLGLQTAVSERQRDIAHEQLSAVNSVLTAPDASSGKSSQNGGVTVVASRAQGKAVVLAGGLPALDSRHVYQVWLIGSDGASSAGLLQPDGPGRMRPLLADLPAGTEQVGITVEPAGGSRAPTTPATATISLDGH